jgi:hypothetical protein
MRLTLPRVRRGLCSRPATNHSNLVGPLKCKLMWWTSEKRCGNSNGGKRYFWTMTPFQAIFALVNKGSLSGNSGVSVPSSSETIILFWEEIWWPWTLKLIIVFSLSPTWRAASHAWQLGNLQVTHAVTFSWSAVARCAFASIPQDHDSTTGCRSLAASQPPSRGSHKPASLIAHRSPRRCRRSRVQRQR